MNCIVFPVKIVQIMLEFDRHNQLINLYNQKTTPSSNQIKNHKMKRTERPIDPSKQRSSKKIKITPPPTTLKKQQMFLNTTSAAQEPVISHAATLIDDYVSEEDVLKKQNLLESLEKFSSKQILFALLMNEEDDEPFAIQFSQCAAQIDRGVYSKEVYLLSHYDHIKNASDDFSLEKFSSTHTPNKSFDTIVPQILYNYSLSRIRCKFISLIEVMLRGDLDQLSLFYSSNMNSFISLAHTLSCMNHIQEIHQVVIQTIFINIKKTNIKECAQKYAMYKRNTRSDSDDEDDVDSDSEDTLNEALGSTRSLRKNYIAEICEEVEFWEGEYPFSGFIKGNHSWDHALDAIQYTNNNPITFF